MGNFEKYLAINGEEAISELNRFALLHGAPLIDEECNKCADDITETISSHTKLKRGASGHKGVGAKLNMLLTMALGKADGDDKIGSFEVSSTTRNVLTSLVTALGFLSDKNHSTAYRLVLRCICPNFINIRNKKESFIYCHSTCQSYS